MSQTGISPASPSQVEAMISLLTDTSDSVVEGCREALLANADTAEPLLRERLAAGSDAEAAVVKRVLADIAGRRIEPLVQEHLVGEPRLEEGSILIGRLVHGDEAPEGVSAALDAMADQVMAQLGGTRDAEADVDVLRRVLVDQNGLTGVPPEEATLADALLDGVTTSGRGMPLPLCMTWILVAQRARVPLVGVNMPGHFLVRIGPPDRPVILDPFHGGKVMSPELCRRYLTAQHLPSTDLSALDASDLDMLLRTLRNLINLAERDGERGLVERCARLLGAAGEG